MRITLAPPKGTKLLILVQVLGLATGGHGRLRAGLVGVPRSRRCLFIFPANRDRALISSARDQLTGQPVAVKKIMKPFSTPVLSKRTYRELKLLKHLRHENVRICSSPPRIATPDVLTATADYQLERYLHLPPRGHVRLVTRDGTRRRLMALATL